jgi:UDP-N-acetylglucosamine--N-acetylmuramyl-(pentapeptide) pyrophosphoryl-undecaprenol N-acetylglucosamine transferase
MISTLLDQAGPARRLDGNPSADLDLDRFRKIEKLGNPVRKAIVAALEKVEDTSSPDGKLRILVVGGSQGARAVSELVLGAAAALAARKVDFTLVHQTGNTDFERIQNRYRELGLEARVEVRPFIDNMAAAYGAADLVIGRAGALTLAELAIVGKPAVLVPLPTAADDHQSKNAACFAEVGAAVVLDQRKWSAEDLAEAVEVLARDREKRVAMGKALRELARPRAAQAIVDRLQGLVARR